MFSFLNNFETINTIIIDNKILITIVILKYGIKESILEVLIIKFIDETIFKIGTNE